MNRWNCIFAFSCLFLLSGCAQYKESGGMAGTMEWNGNPGKKHKTRVFYHENGVYGTTDATYKKYRRGEPIDSFARYMLDSLVGQSKGPTRFRMKKGWQSGLVTLRTKNSGSYVVSAETLRDYKRGKPVRDDIRHVLDSIRRHDAAVDSLRRIKDPRVCNDFFERHYRKYHKAYRRGEPMPLQVLAVMDSLENISVE